MTATYKIERLRKYVVGYTPPPIVRITVVEQSSAERD